MNSLVKADRILSKDNLIEQRHKDIFHIWKICLKFLMKELICKCCEELSKSKK